MKILLHLSTPKFNCSFFVLLLSSEILNHINLSPFFIIYNLFHCLILCLLGVHSHLPNLLLTFYSVLFLAFMYFHVLILSVENDVKHNYASYAERPSSPPIPTPIGTKCSYSEKNNISTGVF